MFPVLQIGPFALPTPAIILLLSVWVSVYLAERVAPRFRLNPGVVSNLMFLLLGSGLVGARLSYLARYPSTFLHNPLDILSRSPGLLDPAGGVAAAALAGVIYVQRKRLPLWTLLDALSNPMALMSVALALSNLASGNGFGKATTLPWGIELWGAVRHPAQIYEMLAAAVIFWLTLPRNKWWMNAKPGVIFLSFIAMSSAARVFLEYFRGDSRLIFETIRAAQLVAWLALALSLWGLNRRLQ